MRSIKEQEEDSVKVWVVVDKSGSNICVWGVFSNKEEAENVSDSQEWFCNSKVIESTLDEREKQNE
jgi:hypothetical protein